MSDMPDRQAAAGGYSFGTFAGVFLPNILAILGVILFLRTGWVVGQAGLGYAVAIILLAHFVTLVTGLSIAALSTNMTVKAGGAYYIISRSLGVEIGGCIGIPLAVSQILSIPFYLVGFAESVQPLLPQLPPWAISGAALVVIALVSVRGTDIAIKAQYFVVAGIVVALVSMFTGSPTGPQISPVIWGDFGPGSFWTVFAVFFPAVTGIMSGVSMSGDLKDPRRSIPLGTLGSIGVGLVVYLVTGVFLAFYAGADQLAQNNDIVLQIARWRPLVYVGIWCATLSSALGFVLGAPRTTQAVALDGVLPRFLARESGAKREPRVALLFALGCSAAVLFIGNLDAIAAVLSMFFLTTYGTLNLVAGLETLVDNPSYRPRLRVPWWLSLAGALSCFAVMFLIDSLSTIIALSIVAVIYLVLKKRRLDSAWGDLRRGIWMSLIRRALLQVEHYPSHDKNWRPNIVVLTEIPQGRLDLVNFAHWFGQRNGVVTIRHMMVGPYERLQRRRRMAVNNLARFIRDNHLLAFGAVDVVRDRADDLRLILESQGYGSFQGNTVLMDWAERAERGSEDFEQTVAAILATGKTLLLLRVDVDRRFGAQDTIDLWPANADDTALMLILADLLGRNSSWRRARVRLFRTIRAESERESAVADAERITAASRIRCEINVILDEVGGVEELARHSVNTSLVLRSVSAEPGAPPDFAAIDRALEQLPTTLLVKADQRLDLSV